MYLKSSRVSNFSKKGIDQKYVIRLYKGGHTAGEIARRLGVTDSSIYYILARFGVPRRTRDVYDEKTRDRIVSLYREGKSAYRIFREVGGSVASVYRTLMKRGIPRKDARSKYISKEDIFHYYNDENMTQEEVGGLFGVPYYQVYRLMKKYDIPARKTIGEDHPGWKGGRHVQSGGRVYIRNKTHPNATGIGYVFEHILVMEKKIGRYLTDGEVIHHIDLNPANNNIDNLYLCRNMREHGSIHKTLYKCIRETNVVKTLMNEGRIIFKNGVYEVVPKIEDSV